MFGKAGSAAECSALLYPCLLYTSIELKGRVEEALKVLMRQMLVQKNGSIYVFLTDEEQEVNNAVSYTHLCSRSERKTLAHMRGKC